MPVVRPICIRNLTHERLHCARPWSKLIQLVVLTLYLVCLTHLQRRNQAAENRELHRRTRDLVVASILAVILLLLLPLGYQAVWDGTFDLTIVISSDQAIDESSLLFATCWQESEALHAIEDPSVYDYGFRTARTSVTGQFSIDVPCSGRVNAYGLGSTYNHPRFLIVEYRLSDDSEPSVRKLLGIPMGRGPRRMTVELP